MRAGSDMAAGLYPPAGGPLTSMAMMPIGMRMTVFPLTIDDSNPECATVKSVCKQAIAYCRDGKAAPTAVFTIDLSVVILNNELSALVPGGSSNVETGRYTRRAGPPGGSAV